MKGVRKMAKFIAIVVDDVNPETGDASEGLFPFLLRSYPGGEVIIADSFEEMKKEVDRDIEDFIDHYKVHHPGCNVFRKDIGYDPTVKFLSRVYHDDYIVCTWVIEQIE